MSTVTTKNFSSFLLGEQRNSVLGSCVRRITSSQVLLPPPRPHLSDKPPRCSPSWAATPLAARRSSSSSKATPASSQSWSEEWKALGLGARLPEGDDARITNLLFVQMGFGVDQHGNDPGNAGGSGGGATKAAVRAVRNAIEFNSIPGVVEAVPGGRAEMLISGEDVFSSVGIA